MATVSKRKRGIRTSAFQYETYLNFMTENPTLPSNFIAEKWEILTEKLNTCDSGPILTSSEWQTRFTNWKNSTRQKARNIIANKKTPGGGPGNELTPLEERGLAVWGEVAVSGTPKLPHIGGLQSCEIVNDTNQHIKVEIVDVIHEFEKMDETHSASLPEHTQNELSVKRKHSNYNQNHNQTIQNTGADSMETYKTDSRLRPNHSEVCCNLEKQKLLIEKVRLQFEISKYKFENPSFRFDDSELSQIT